MVKKVMNHETSPLTFKGSKQLYGSCENVADKAHSGHTVILRSNNGLKYFRDRYSKVRVSNELLYNTLQIWL